MLAEWLNEIGCKIKQANTDGLFLLVKKDKYQEYKRICKKWEDLTQLVLEDDHFECMYQYAINDYIAVKEGYTKLKTELLTKGEASDSKNTYHSLEELKNAYIKQKGMFITKVALGKGLTPKIIPEAIINYLVDGTPVNDTIVNCTDIKKFLMAEKTGKQWRVEYNGKEIQRINRFYASTDGAYLWKWKTVQYEPKWDEEPITMCIVALNDGTVEKVPSTLVAFNGPYYMNPRVVSIQHTDEIWIPKEWKKYQNMLTASGVTLLNKFDDKPITDRKINYRYYFGECMKIIEELKPRQLSLW